MRYVAILHAILESFNTSGACIIILLLITLVSAIHFGPESKTTEGFGGALLLALKSGASTTSTTVAVKEIEPKT